MSIERQGEISDFKMQIQQQLEKDSLIEGGTTKKKSFSTAKGPVLVPLGAPRKYGNEVTKTFTVAPPAPPSSSTKDFPALVRERFSCIFCVTHIYFSFMDSSLLL